MTIWVRKEFRKKWLIFFNSHLIHIFLLLNLRLSGNSRSYFFPIFIRKSTTNTRITFKNFYQIIFRKLCTKNPILLLESRPSMWTPSITQIVTLTQIVARFFWPHENVTIMSGDSPANFHLNNSLKTYKSSSHLDKNTPFL